LVGIEQSGGVLTINSSLYSSLNWFFKDISLPPHINHSSDSLLDICWGTLVRCSGSFGNEWREGNQEILLMTDLGLLANL
jgi:hypothetical protein